MTAQADSLRAIRGTSERRTPAGWTEWTPASGTAFASIVLLGYIVYYSLLSLEVPFSGLPTLLWYGFVYVVPSRLVFSLGSPSDADPSDSGRLGRMSLSAHTRQKSEVLRKVFGLDAHGLLKGMPGDRSIRRLSVLLKGPAVDVPPGLGNWDNSCYQNSVIQGLASLRSLRDFLARSTSAFGALPQESTNHALSNTIAKLNDPIHAGQRLWTPTKLKSMSSWQQQDAQEYFSKVLDEMEREIMQASKGRARTDGLEQAVHVPPTCAGSGGAENDPTRPSASDPLAPTDPRLTTAVLQNPLEGLLAQRVGCMRCGHSEGLSMIPFNCLTVPLGRHWSYDVHDCLTAYTALEPIEGVECAKCTLTRTEENLRRLLASNSDPTSSTPASLRHTLGARLQAVRDALDDEDFSDHRLVQACQIPKTHWVSSTKSRQAVVARAPEALVIHVNRSMFDEYTGAQLKNYADVTFPARLDLGPWCLGAAASDDAATEQWPMDPSVSMLAGHGASGPPHAQYGLRAVVTHYGRHENGHYICYRPDPFLPSDHPTTPATRHGHVERAAHDAQWWCLSDEDVSRVSEDVVLRQGGVFMLFYEQVRPNAQRIPLPVDPLATAPVVGESTSLIDETLTPPRVPHDEEIVGDGIHDEADEPRPVHPVAAAPVTGPPPPPINETHPLAPVPTHEESAHDEAHASADPPPTATPPDDVPTAPEPRRSTPPADLVTRGDTRNATDDSPQAGADDTESTPLDEVEAIDESPPSVPNGMRMRTAGPSSSVHGDEPLSPPFRMVAAT